MKKKNNRRSFDALTDAEKEAVYQECERVLPEHGAPLNAKDRARHRRAGIPVGRPKIGQGAKRINISMEQGLLRIADATARKKGISRARLIAESVRAYIAGAA